jgi:hypothetical protein
MLELNALTTVRDLLTVHPGVFPILLRYGMCPDCQASPPPVPLGTFAAKHCGGNLEGLIAELRRAIGPRP